MPPIDEEWERRIRAEAEIFEDNPATQELDFREHTPGSGEPYTNIDCSKGVTTGVEELGLKVDEVRLAREIAGVFEKYGEEVELDTVVKPIEQSGHMSLIRKRANLGRL